MKMHRKAITLWKCLTAGEYGVGASEADKCTDVYFQNSPLILGGHPTHIPIPSINKQPLAIDKRRRPGWTQAPLSHTTAPMLISARGG